MSGTANRRKHILSISLGSATRNKRVEAELFGTPFCIERIGTDGDQRRFRNLVAEWDGKVDAFGVGGADIFVYAGGKRYTFQQIAKLLEPAVRTPYVDGSGLKNTLERDAIEWLQNQGIVDFGQKRVLLVSAVDRFGMAEALSNHARSVVFGDFLFGLGLPIPIRTLQTLNRIAKLLLPVVVRLPFQWLYPTGKQQTESRPRFQPFFANADIIAGDFLYILRNLPLSLRGKIVLTNTVTQEDTLLLAQRGLHLLITTTPVLDGRAFATNVMEATIVAHSGLSPEHLSPSHYRRFLKEANWTPTVRELNPLLP